MPTFSFDTASDCFNRYPISKDPSICMQHFESGDLPGCLDKISFDHTHCFYYMKSSGTVLQPFQCAWTPKGGAEQTACSYTLQKGKMDFEWSCEQLEAFWNTCYNNDFYQNTSGDPMFWRLPQYMIQNIIMPQLTQDMFNVRWNGKRVDPTAGVAGEALETYDGFACIIANAITEGKLTPISLGELTKETIIEQLKCFIESIPKHYRSAMPGWKLMASCEAVRCLMDARNERKYPSCCVDEAGSFSAMVPGYNIELVGVQELEGTNTVIWTRADNMFEACRTGEGLNPNLYFHKEKRGLCAMLEMHRAFGVKCWDKFFISDSFQLPSGLDVKATNTTELVGGGKGKLQAAK